MYRCHMYFSHGRKGISPVLESLEQTSGWSSRCFAPRDRERSGVISLGVLGNEVSYFEQVAVISVHFSSRHTVPCKCRLQPNDDVFAYGLIEFDSLRKHNKCSASSKKKCTPICLYYFKRWMWHKLVSCVSYIQHTERQPVVLNKNSTIRLFRLPTIWKTVLLSNFVFAPWVHHVSSICTLWISVSVWIQFVDFPSTSFLVIVLLLESWSRK